MKTLSTTHLALLYLAYFWSLGTAVPYVPVAMKRAGFTGDEMGIAMAVSLALMLSTPPFWGWVADRYGLGSRLLVIGASGAALGMGIAALVPGKLAFAGGLAVYACTRTPVSPLLDALVLAHPDVGSAGFGRVRRWGSLGFVLSAFSTGLVVDWLPASSIVGLVALCWVALVVLAVGFGLARAPLPARPIALQTDRLYRSREVWAFLAVSAIHYGCLVPYETYFAIHAQDVGLQGRWVGTGWALGVGLEVIVLTHLDALVNRFELKRLLIVAYITGMVRWALTAAIPSGVCLALIQVMHGVSFGAYFGASVVWMNRLVPVQLRSSAQSVFAAVVWGGGGIAAQLICGPVYAKYGGRALFAGASVIEFIPLIALLVWLRAPMQEKSSPTD